MAPTLTSLAPWLLLTGLIASLSAYVALDLGKRMRSAELAEGRQWLLGSGLAWGTGVWSVHVLSMSFESLPYPVGYHPVGVFSAWLAAVGVGMAGFRTVGQHDITLTGVLGAAGGVGLGLVATQLVAMLSMGLQPGFSWDGPGLLQALLAGIGGSTFGLGLWFYGRNQPDSRVPWNMVSALSMGIAVLVSQEGVMNAAGLTGQVGSAYRDVLPSSAIVSLASVGTLMFVLAMLVSSRLEEHTRESLSQAKTELRHQSQRDPLTRLANRAAFELRLDEVSRLADVAQTRLALLYIDIDGFKPINDSYGHPVGDSILRAVAARLGSVAGPGDLPVRLSADEFLLLVVDNPSRGDVAQRAAALLELLNQPFQIESRDTREVVLTASMGVAMYPDDGGAAKLLANADAAMNAAKGAGGSTYCFYEPRMSTGAREQVDLLNDLRRALANRELELYYQPKVHAPSGEITGAEALMRWHHPTRGMISPAVFIPIAERFGLINPLGNWVIDEACRQARAWRDEGLRMRVAVNLSVYQLRQADLAERIGEALQRYNINPKLLTCEITESVAMEDAVETMKVFDRLAQVGVHISIDDFGTGYSSLSYLRKLPAEELKIDRSFVQDLGINEDAERVVDAVIKLAQALQLKVVAEGVETEQQYAILRALGCDELQGYLFAKPMSARTLSLWAMNDIGPKDMDFRESLYGDTRMAELH
ncbi:EAL domain-containing protein [Piscinibacter sakaiensis]|uniref:Diguanylate cyclase/phosphodiesterase with PAS/PAC sensor(S) n=1 Tax=Piscinibacter sakaiensis TaxID=1547922 RepID=A0A0K8NXA6_PISS1|nr:EAL domain-containing protein [Piscinibacter sakaiensis]GAP35032.1 diguanylate cyclase/phosphodiesterase with PAS/PAC sensor(s) [Piscinibacter sakaiensis]